MKKLILFILSFFFCICVFSQKRNETIPLLDDYTFDGDTSVYVAHNHAYDWSLQVTGTSLTGTFNGTVGIKEKISGHDQYVYVCNDTTSTSGCKQTINAANYSVIIKGSTLQADSLLIEFLNNGITGGTIDADVKFLVK